MTNLKSNIIRARLIENQDAGDFLFKKLGKNCIYFEDKVFKWMKELNTEYSGGLWDCFALSNGGMYMSPVEKENYLLESPNGSSELVPTNIAGIVVSLFALNELACTIRRDSVIQLYWNLRDFVPQQEERKIILRLID